MLRPDAKTAPVVVELISTVMIAPMIILFFVVITDYPLFLHLILFGSSLQNSIQ
jgi:hypothetical protein